VVLNLLARLRRELDLTMLFITHNLGSVRQVADRVAVMYLGTIVEQAAAEELFERPCHPYSEALFSAVPVPDPTARQPATAAAGSPATIPSAGPVE